MTNSRISAFAVISLLFFALGCGPDMSSAPTPGSAKKSNANKSEQSTSSDTNDSASSMPSENIDKAKALIASVDMPKVDAMDGKAIYKKYCSVCHGFKGDMQMNGAKDLRKLRTSLEERVAQVYFGKGLMTPFKGILEDDEIIAVSKYVKTLRTN